MKKIFCNLKDNKITNLQFPVDDIALETCKEGLTKNDYIVLDLDNGIIDKTTKIYDEHNQPLYEIKDNKPSLITDTNRLPKLKEIYKNKVSQMSFQKRQVKLKDYKLVNAAMGIYTTTIKTNIKNCVVAYRTEYYRMAGLMDKAKNEDELKAILNGQNYDGISYE